ncbi:MAG: sigma-70 family RNA polymerase sigma factor [Verrucomicrobiota bacterium]
MIDDTELLRRYALEGDEAAFAELVERYAGLVYGAALRQLDGAAHRAEDVTQSVFADLARKARTLTGRGDLTGWLYTSAHFAAAKLKRSEQRRQAREQGAQLMHEIEADAAGEKGAWDQVRPVLDEVLLALPERDREALLLRFFHGRRLAEVGRALQVSEDAARMRVERALEKLRTGLARRGVTSTAAALGLTLGAHASTAAPVGLAASVASGVIAAGAGVTAVGPLLAAIQFMNATKIAVGGAAAMAALTIGTAVYQVREARAAEAALAGLRQGEEAQRMALRDGERRWKDAEQAIAARQRELDAVRAKQAVDRSRAMPAGAEAQKREADAFMAQHPALRQALKNELQAEAAAQFAGFFKERRLTPAQIERFTDLITRGIVGRRAGDLRGNVPFSTAGNSEEANRELIAMIGPEGFERAQVYEAATAGIQYTSKVAAHLADTETPLSAGQGEQLRELLLNNSTRKDTKTRIDWGAVMAQAPTFLSPTQLGLLQAFRAGDELEEGYRALRLRAQDGKRRN